MRDLRKFMLANKVFSRSGVDIIRWRSVVGTLLGNLKVLKDRVEHGAKYFDGICNEAYSEGYHHTINSDGLLREIFPSWEKYSGNRLYPIPCPDGYCPEDRYGETHRTDMYSSSHPYGLLRLELLDWLIDELEGVYYED